MTNRLPAPLLEIGQELNGFSLKAIYPISDIRCRAYFFEHKLTGASYLHLHANDSENLFSINVPTPPADDTGLPHILEHVVLAGSQKYPVRDTLFEILKMSVGTFINAMTSWDCTYYPVASNVRQDLFNLADVYFDAVFHPQLRPEVFRREGVHFRPVDLDDPNSDLVVDGIVYNEMSAAFSQPDEMLERTVFRNLLPDTIYAHESGGDPDAIPELTYQQLLDFFNTFYHPTNVMFLTYGDITPQEFTAFLEERLTGFTRQQPPAAKMRQQKWTQPRVLNTEYPVEGSLKNKTYHVLSWLTGEGGNPQHSLLLELLNLILLGNEGAPLKKTIIDAGLGQDLTFSGFCQIGPDNMFSVGIKGSEPENAKPFLDLVCQTLQDLAETTIDPELVNSAFRQLSYKYREIQSLYPLHLHQHVLDVWLYDRQNPTAMLQIDTLLKSCRDAYEADSKLFNELIRSTLLENQHRLAVTMKPDPHWQKKHDAVFRERMAEKRSHLSEADMQRLAREAKELAEDVAKPTSPENIAKLPQLHISDLPGEPRTVPCEMSTLANEVDFIHNHVFSNGINYIHLSFDLTEFPQALWRFVPRYQQAMVKMGTENADYTQVARRIAAATGGIGCTTTLTSHCRNPQKKVWTIQLTLKALDEQFECALELLTELLFELNPNDPARLVQLLPQSCAELQSSLIQDGLRTAVTRAASHMTPEGFLQEQLNGAPQLQMVQQMLDHFDEDHQFLVEKVRSIARSVPAAGRVAVGFTGSQVNAEKLSRTIEAWPLTTAADFDVEDQSSVAFNPSHVPFYEALVAPLQTAHSACFLPAPHLSDPDAPLLALACNFLTSEHIIPEIRLMGNAYGAHCQYRADVGAIELTSYADPDPAHSIKVYQSLLDYVNSMQLTRIQLDHTILGWAKNFLSPIRPLAATNETLSYYKTGKDQEWLTAYYQRGLKTTPSELKRAILTVLEQAKGCERVCVIANQSTVDKLCKDYQDVTWTHDNLSTMNA